MLVISAEALREQQVIEHVQGHLAGFKAPRKVVFAALPKTSTGKIRKNVVRAQVRP